MRKKLGEREIFLSSFLVYLLYIDVVRLKNETTAQCDCAKENMHVTTL